MRYDNPVILGDYSDPDVIRRGDNFYMVASSFNHTPGVPVLKSKNLVDWKIINYVYEDIPFSRFIDVCHGDGAWAPAIRYHNGLFYVIIPFPDEGIYIATTADIEKGNWSKPWCFVYLKGILVNDLEKGVRFIVKRYRPVEKTPVAKSNPSWFQLLIPAVHKTSESTM